MSAAATIATGDRRTAVAVIALGTTGVLLLAVALATSVPVLIAPSAALVGCAYVVVRGVEGGALDLDAPLVGVALLLVCELGYWAHELRTTAPDEPGARPRRAAWLALLGVCTLVPTAVVLAVADAVRVGGIAVEAVGTVAALALLGGLLLIVRRQTPG